MWNRTLYLVGKIKSVNINIKSYTAIKIIQLIFCVNQYSIYIKNAGSAICIDLYMLDRNEHGNAMTMHSLLVCCLLFVVVAAVEFLSLHESHIF